MADLEPPTALIFDFDGTLADDLPLSLDILYRLVHHRPLPAEDVTAIRGMRIIGILRRLHISPWRALLLRRRAYHAMAGRLDELMPVAGIAAVIQKLASRHPLFIVSSNDTPNVTAALKQFHLDQYVRGVQGEANPLNKAGALRQLAQRYQLNRGSTWYIGDQPGDVRAAHRAGLRAVAVSWGFSNLRTLEAAHPDFLAFTPEELLAHFDHKAKDNG